MGAAIGPPVGGSSAGGMSVFARRRDGVGAVGRSGVRAVVADWLHSAVKGPNG